MLAIFEHGNQNDIIKKVQIIRERFQLTKGITTVRGLEAIKREVDGYDTVLICDFDPTMKSEVLKYCYAKNKRIYLLPSSADTILNGSYQVQVFDTPVLFLHNGGLSMEQRIIKRIFDILLSLLGIIVLSPIMLITAIAIKLTSKGPIIFKQKRITRDQKEFCIYKFRSMKVSDTNEVKENDGRRRPGDCGRQNYPSAAYRRNAAAFQYPVRRYVNSRTETRNEGAC